MNDITNSSNSPLRYPGGKGKISKFMNHVLNVNGLNGTYVEPFAGGAGIAINLLLADKIDSIIINDLDSSVYTFWKTVLSNCDELIDLIDAVPFDYYDHAESLSPGERYKFWVATKHNFEFYKGTHSTKEAYYFFMLNRLNVSGIISGGPIGGEKQNGTYNISSRLNKKNLIRKILKISEQSERISVKNLEATQLLTQYSMGKLCDTDNALLFVDPPYYKQGRALYNSYMTDTLHSMIAKSLLDNIQQNWILTYDTAPQIVELYPYSQIQKYRYKIQYSANKRGKFNEFMFISPNLNISSFDNVLLSNLT